MEGFEARAFVYTGDVDDALHAVIPPEATHVRVTNSVVEIPAQTFLNRRNLETVELTHGLQIIGRDCFEGCRSLKNIIIPPTVTEIRRFAFAGCHDITALDLPDRLQILETGALVSCLWLRRVVIPPTIQNLGSHVMAFCIRLTQVSLPNGLVLIPRRAFRQCISLTSIFIPSTVTIIQAGAFLDCKNLLSIELPERLNRIESEAFMKCEDLRNIVVPSSVTHVGHNVFDGCTKLYDIIPAGVDDNQLLEALRRRFDDYPIHELCYYQGHRSIPETLVQMNLIFATQDASNDPPPQITDATFGMTPLHVLSLAAKPDLEITLLMLQRYFDNHITEDSWGKLPVVYFCQNAPLNSVKIIKCLGRSILDSLLELFNLKNWRSQIARDIDNLEENEIDCKIRCTQIHHALKLVDKYRMKEKLCSVELLLWRLQMKSLLELKNKEENHMERPRKMARTKETRPTDYQLLSLEDRVNCRTTCGIDIVVSNIVPFLGKF